MTSSTIMTKTPTSTTAVTVAAVAAAATATSATIHLKPSPTTSPPQPTKYSLSAATNKTENSKVLAVAETSATMAKTSQNEIENMNRKSISESRLSKDQCM